MDLVREQTEIQAEGRLPERKTAAWLLEHSDAHAAEENHNAALMAEYLE